MSKVKHILIGLVCLVVAVLAVVMTVHDADFLFGGKTVDLNEIIVNGEELPRDAYVTYTCNVSLGNYAEAQDYISGLIPIPWSKTQQYAILTEDGSIISAEIGDLGKIADMDKLTNSYEDECVPVVLVGCLQTNSSDMNRYLNEYFEGFDLQENGMGLTPFVIKTTRTQFSQIFLYSACFLIGLAGIFISVRNFLKR